MQVQQSHADRVQKSSASDPAPVLYPFNEFDTALKRSQNYLLNVQKPEGYWVGELMVDVTLIADLVAYHHWDRSVDKAWEKKAVHHIFEKQLPDGGWNIYYGGPAEVNATIKAYLALKLAGVVDVPAAVGELLGEDVVDRLALPFGIHVARPMVVGDHVRDERHVHHEFADPVALGLLDAQQIILRPLERGFKSIRRHHGRSGCVGGDSSVRLGKRAN